MALTLASNFPHPRTSLSGGKGCQIDVWSVHDGTAHSVGNGPHYVTSVALKGFYPWMGVKPTQCLDAAETKPHKLLFIW